MLAVSSWIVLLIYMAPCIFAQKCHTNISDAHYKFIDELISTQANLCKIPVKILNKDIVTDTCDFWALVHELNGLLEKFIFTPNTENYKKTYELKQTYIGCLDDIQGDEKNVLDIYLQTSYMNAEEILTKVKDSLKKLKVLKASEYPWDCISYYETHGQQNNDVLKGPHCTCPSPTPSIFSSEASQTPLSYLSELASSTHTTSLFLDTSSLAEGMSGSYPEKLTSPQKNSQGVDSSPFISTKTPSDLKPLTTTVDHSYTGATEQSEAYTNSPLTNSDFTVHSTEFTKGLHEPSYVSPNPSQTRTDSEQVHTSTSDTTSEGTYGLSIATEPNERKETAMSEFVSQKPKGSVFQTFLPVPSKEPSIDTSSISVTKIRRSLSNMDDISTAAVTTEAVSSLSTSANDPNLPFQNSVHTNIPSSEMGLLNTEAPELVSQGKVTMDRNLGWASSYFSSTMLTSETELSMSSSTPGGKLLLADVIPSPVLNAQTSYNNLSQQERDLAIDDRQNSSSGPTQGSNKLLLIATAEGRNEKLSQSNIAVIIIAILGVLVLLLLCGLLYYQHQCRVLERRLNINYDIDLSRNAGAVLPEERVQLHTIEGEIV